MTTPAARDRLWPLWATAAGVAGFVATIIMDTRPPSETEAFRAGNPIVLDDSYMHELSHTTNYLGMLFGYVAVACLIAFAAAWRSRVELVHQRSIIAAVVSGGVLVTAAGLALAYGWKGALANYGYGGPEHGYYDDPALYIYYMLTDFGPYIPWLGVLVAFAAIAWLAWVERLVSRVLGTVLGIYAILIAGAVMVTGVPGLPGPLSGIVLAITGVWLSVGRSRVTLRPAATGGRRVASDTPDIPVADAPAESSASA